MTSRWYWIGILVALALAGCEMQQGGETQSAESTDPAVESTPPPADATAEPSETAEATAPEPAETSTEPSAESQPAEAAPAAESTPPPPVQASTELEGMQLNPKDGVQILLPDGWEQTPADDGSLLQMVRRGLIDGVRVTVTLDYAVDQKTKTGADLGALEQDFVAQMKDILKDQRFNPVATKRVSVAGFPALAVTGDLEDQGQQFRLKQYLILQGETFWTLSVIGPRASFESQVEPEFDAIASTLEIE